MDIAVARPKPVRLSTLPPAAQRIVAAILAAQKAAEARERDKAA